jgi:hypothetical protein
MIRRWNRLKEVDRAALEYRCNARRLTRSVVPTASGYRQNWEDIQAPEIGLGSRGTLIVMGLTAAMAVGCASKSRCKRGC